MHLKRLFTFLKCFERNESNTRRFKSTNTEIIEVLSSHFALPEGKSTKLAAKAKLKDKDIDDLKDTLKVLEKLGYKKKLILDCPNILKKRSRILREQHLILQEAGFSNLNLDTLLNFRRHISKKICNLKHRNFIPSHVNVPETLIMHLNPKPYDSFVDDFTEDQALSYVHYSITKRYLQWRLEANSDEIETFFRIYSGSLKYRSFANICKNIEFAIDLGFTPRKLLGFGYLISNDPEFPTEVLRKMPNLAGADMKVMMRRFPKLITIPAKQYMKIYNILKEEEIPDSTIQKQMNIFTLSPDTVKTRFNELREIPEMNVLRQSPRILRLIVHYNRAKSRLSFMHQLQLKCATMCLLEHDNEHYFNNYVRNTKDTNVFGDVLRLLRHLLNSDTPEIEYNLRKHPYYLQVPLVNIEKTCKHVQKSFSNSAIIKVAPIVLYPCEKIQNALNEIKSMSDLPQARLTEAKKLNLALYLIEKDHHFTGDGVWENPPTIK